MTTVYIGLGSNLGDSLRTIQQAIDDLSSIPESTVIASSAFYQSVAVGPGKQPDYINAAVTLETNLPPLSLLDELQTLEHKHHRTRGPIRWSARTLDLDLLLYGDQEINNERLTVPHPRIAERNFVLLPLQDLDPNLRFPNGVYLIDLVKQTPQTGIKRLQGIA